MSATPKRALKGIAVLIAGTLVAALLLLHSLLPTSRGIALVVESALPWTWILIVLVVLAGLIRFSVLSIIGVLVPAIVWAAMFGAYLRPAHAPEHSGLVVATQNVGARGSQPTATVQALTEHQPDIVAVEELESLSGKIIRKRLDGKFSHSHVADTVGVWTKWPLKDTEEIGLGLQWPRAFATTVQTDEGDVRFYAVHMPSVRPGQESLRNAALSKLAEVVRADRSQRIIVAGDFNAGSSDRYFSELSSQLTDTRRAVGGGFGFTWPAQFPLVRLDHILVRGLTPTGDSVMGEGTSDHRGVIGYLDVP
ncbi:endonuclease [Brevibacterium sp. 5221]|uniref:Endonuclease n=1 Tax=Brevibacterium rongguiense TaxID=2695267 RepID=A0A6N9H724_9MICO|nr:MULTISPECIES: endonuclease/exonuclease/phosphatase family protein [Brevibacterium]MYM19868.1 endonuclease [Brevibacterium rongguiense]WAL39229.1 endonuclease/exonuclease/phosphatase family protein [Brevibacterium sp. BRM-1]